MKNSYFTNLSLPKLDFAILMFRVGISALMLTHGIPKVIDLFDGGGLEHHIDPIGIGEEASLALATFAEFICSILLILGLGTRLAALALILNMGVAAFVQLHFVDFTDPHKQMALLFLLAYLFLFYSGSGRFSLDQYFLMQKKRKA